MNRHEHGSLFQLATRVFTVFMLVLFGVAIACVITIVCGGSHLVSPLFNDVWMCLGRMAVVVVCGLIIGVVGESLR